MTVSSDRTIAARVAAGERVVVRNRSQRRWALAGVAMFAGAAMLAEDAGELAIIAAGILLLATAAFRPSVALSSDHVVVTNMLWPRAFPWAAIADVDTRGYYRGTSLTLALVGGKNIRCWAVDTGPGNRFRWVDDITLQVATVWETATRRESTIHLLQRYDALVQNRIAD